MHNYFSMETRKRISIVAVIILIGIVIWYEMPSINAELKIEEVKTTDTNKVIYVTKQLILEAENSLELAADLKGIDSPEYILANEQYKQAISQLDKLYELYPFSVNVTFTLSNSKGTSLTLRNIQAEAILGSHSLIQKEVNHRIDALKPGESKSGAILLEAMNKQSSIALYNHTNVIGNITFNVRLKARFNSKKITETSEILYKTPNN
jgi:hypothetical protein